MLLARSACAHWKGTARKESRKQGTSAKATIQEAGMVIAKIQIAKTGRIQIVTTGIIEIRITGIIEIKEVVRQAAATVAAQEENGTSAHKNQKISNKLNRSPWRTVFFVINGGKWMTRSCKI